MKKTQYFTAAQAAYLLLSLPAQSAVVWQDEFDGPGIDTETWVWDVGQHGFGNGQLEYDTARAKNSYIENGSLVIEAFRENYFGMEFTSARLNTQGRFAFKYGTLEARIRMPDTGNGLWPAFWLLGNNFPGIAWPDAGEIDIVEMGSASGIADGKQQERINSAIHYSDGADAYDYAAEWYDAPVDLSQGYHLYKVEWTPVSLTFFLDGVQFASWNIEAAHFAEFHQPHFPILNLAIGGWDPSYTGVYSPAGVTALPVVGSSARMYIDWIRLEENPHTEIFLGADTEEDGIFGVFTETTPVNNALVYGDDTDPAFVYGYEAALFTWNNMTEAAVPADPAEGSEVWTFDIAAGQWFGMGVFLPNFRNMKNYSDGFLHFDIKTTLTDDIKIGVKSSRGGESWQWVGDETVAPGFARDGQWHTVSIPLNGYSNTDFNTIHQIFMIAADSASASTTLSIDNVYWEPSVARPRPSNGNFGVFTETAANQTAGAYELGVDGEFFIWGDTLNPVAQDPYEGAESLSLASAPGLDWFGAAFTPAVKYDLTAWDNPNGKLNFSMKTTSATTFYVGMKSGNLIGPPPVWGGNNDGPAGVGQVWIKFAPGSDPYGFVRDGNWHAIEIPIADIVGDTDLSQVSQLFQILGVDGAISNIELDDIYYSGGRAFETTIVPAVIERGVGISWPSTDGSIYTVQWSTDLGPGAVWNDMAPSVEGDWTTKTVFDPLGSGETRFYRVIELP
ncbi:MAG: glycoside hydrolase family 16 protein [Oceanipulchritudo sp.]